MSTLFVGVISVPIIGKTAEHVVGVLIPHENRMDFSMAVPLGSSVRVTLFVTPMMVFLGPLLGHPLDPVFSVLELGAPAVVVVTTTLSSTWTANRTGWEAPCSVASMPPPPGLLVSP